LPAGTFANTSSSDGIRSPRHRSPFQRPQRPTSSDRNSAKLVSLTTHREPATRCASSSPGVCYVPQSVLDQGLQRLESLSRAAEKGDLAALDELRNQLDSCRYIWQPLVDLQRMIELRLIGLIAGTDPLRAEAFRKRNSELRSDLNGEGGSMLVQLAASRVVAAWMFAQVLEWLVLNSLDEPRVVKKLADAERRLQTAIRTLATVKKLEMQLQQAAT
jgi:hypothetical protein